MSIVLHNEALKPLSVEGINKLEAVTEWMQEQALVSIPVDHLLHAGMYTRTVKIPAGVAVVGVIIKRNTVLTVSGDASIYQDDKPLHLTGYNVIAGYAYRKALIYAHSDTWLSMALPCQAKTAKDAEQWFTDEYERLAYSDDDTVRIGE